MHMMPPEAVKIVLALLLSFLVGLEREERRPQDTGYQFGGVRTFPLIGLIGLALAQLDPASVWPVSVGFAVIGAFLWLSYKHKLEKAQAAGVTTEISGLATYVVGALIARDHIWAATALAVLSLLLLELKGALETLSTRMPGDQIFTFTKFLLLTAVILPIVPNQTYGSFGFNPFKTWLVVVAVSAMSYASYLLQLWTTGKSGILLAAILGGLYSSTAVTIVLAEHGKEEDRPHLFSGAILMASGVMYIRTVALVAIFSLELAKQILAPMLVLTAIGIAAGMFWAMRPDPNKGEVKSQKLAKNPLELSSAFLFAVLFVVMLALTHYAITYLGSGGVYALAALTGFTDITPFILGLANTIGASTPVILAAGGVFIATASNNLIKGGYACAFGDRKTGRESLTLLVIYTVLGLIPLLWLR
jgi:uncharacterized membrane protein (DUF4010 family)